MNSCLLKFEKFFNSLVSEFASTVKNYVLMNSETCKVFPKSVADTNTLLQTVLEYKKLCSLILYTFAKFGLRCLLSKYI